MIALFVRRRTERRKYMISNCGHDERGKYAGGAAGDQTGTEWEIRSWYNRPWNCVLRHPDREVGNMLAELGRAAAKNNLVGYDQGQRGTYWQHLKASNYDPSQITVKCEADCSSGVAANVKAAGYRLGIKALQNVSADCYTGNLRAALKAAGFEVLTASKYLTSDAYLLPGDILLYEGHHTATNLDTGSKAGTSSGSTGGSSTGGSAKVDSAASFDKNLAGTYTTTADLNLRAGAGTSKASLAVIPKGESVQNYGYYTAVSDTKWLYVAYNGKTGFCSSKYLKSGSGSSAGTSGNSNISGGSTANWKATGTATCGGNSVNVRSGPGTSYKSLGQLGKGNRFEIDGQTNGSWTHIKVHLNGKDQIAWISSQYVKKD